MPTYVYKISALDARRSCTIPGWRVQIDAVGPIVVHGLRWEKHAWKCAEIYDKAIESGTTHEAAKAAAQLYLNLIRAPRN
jgi:hypothetical protein